jgi:AraC-like DNA-binding protein
MRISALQFGPTSTASELSRIPMPGQQLDLVQLAAPFEFEGVTSRETATVIFVLDTPGHAHNFNFGTDPVPGHMGFWPTEGPVHSVTPAGYQNASLTLPLEDLVRELESREVRPPPHFFKTGAALKSARATLVAMRRFVREIRDIMDGPDFTLEDPRWRMNLQRVTRAAFADALAGGLQQLVPEARLTLRKSELRFRMARDHIAANLGQPVYLEDLCVASGLSRRGLQQVFRDKTGISPMDYLCLRRLHGVRNDLRSGAGSASIKTVAFKWGFWHLGRFSAEYRRIFGELPSETRRNHHSRHRG